MPSSSLTRGSAEWTRCGTYSFGRFARTPPVHMLRGMQCAGMRWPFASVDSTDIARNHARKQNSARAMADRWDAMQCPAKWSARAEQMELA